MHANIHKKKKYSRKYAKSKWCLIFDHFFRNNSKAGASPKTESPYIESLKAEL